MVWVNVLLLIGVLLQVGGLGWAWVAVRQAWSREWPGQWAFPAWVHRLMFWEKPRAVTAVVDGKGTLSGTATVVEGPKTVEEQLAALALRLDASERELSELRKYIDRRIDEAEGAHQLDLARIDNRAKSQARAGIVGPPILIIAGTILQIAGPIGGFVELLAG